MSGRTRYAKSGDFHIAYQVVGENGPALVYGSRLAFDERGRHALKGVPGEWTLLAARI